MAKSYVMAVPLTSFNTTGVTANFQAINPNGLPHAVIKLRVINASNILLIFSYDGATDHGVIQPNDVITFDFQSNSSPAGYICNMRKGTVVSVRNPAGAAGVGLIYIAAYYQEV